MPVAYSPPERVPAVPGIRLAAVSAGIKTAGRPDLVLLEIAEGATCAAVFTRNAFCAAPVVVARRHLQAGSPRYLLVNSGCANAGTGAQGERDATASCQALAARAGCAEHEILPFSTGVIGAPLPVDRMAGAMPGLLAALDAEGWLEAGRGIMTTDTVPKLASRQCRIGDRTITVTGMAKGSGMIRPDMATMLAFIATDAGVEAGLLQSILDAAVGQSFNCITVDGDTSTNDACVLVATGDAEAGIGHRDDPGCAVLQQAVDDVCRELAQAIVRDGEGATKFVTVAVDGGKDREECALVAYTVAHSPLVKTALFAGDPNWGRILAAVGRSGVENLDISGVDIRLGDVPLIANGEPAPGYTEAAGQAVMNEAEITIAVSLNRGDARHEVWTCDFSYDYVKINAEYRT